MVARLGLHATITHQHQFGGQRVDTKAETQGRALITHDVRRHHVVGVQPLLWQPHEGFKHGKLIHRLLREVLRCSSLVARDEDDEPVAACHAAGSLCVVLEVLLGQPLRRTVLAYPVGPGEGVLRTDVADAAAEQQCEEHDNNSRKNREGPCTTHYSVKLKQMKQHTQKKKT